MCKNLGMSAMNYEQLVDHSANYLWKRDVPSCISAQIKNLYILHKL